MPPETVQSDGMGSAPQNDVYHNRKFGNGFECWVSHALRGAPTLAKSCHHHLRVLDQMAFSQFPTTVHGYDHNQIAEVDSARQRTDEVKQRNERRKCLLFINYRDVRPQVPYSQV